MKKKTICALALTVLLATPMFAQNLVDEQKAVVDTVRETVYDNVEKYVVKAEYNKQDNTPEAYPVPFMNYAFAVAIRNKDVATFNQLYYIASVEIGKDKLADVLKVTFSYFEYTHTKNRDANVPSSSNSIETFMSTYEKIEKEDRSLVLEVLFSRMKMREHMKSLFPTK